MESEIGMLKDTFKKLREKAGISQQEVATKAGLSWSLIAQIEQGKKSDVRVSTLLGLAKALGKLTLTVRDKEVGGQYFLQEYKLAGGQAAGQYSNGHIAAVEHTFGSGKTLLIGTFPGGSYYPKHP